ncbi:MAG: DUF1592 domain-containing protein, partial [Planctomycetota bacterium]
MGIRVVCPQCGAAFTAAERHAGKVARCPGEGCSRKLRVPRERKEVVFKSVEPPRRRSRRRSKSSSGPSKTLLYAGGALAGTFLLGLVAVALLPDAAPTVSSVNTPPPQAAALPPTAGQNSPSDARSSETAGDGELPAAEPRGGLVLAALVEPEQSFEDGVGTFLTKYCTDCHGADYAEADIDLASVSSVEDVRDEREKWERILAIVRVGAMPPSEMDQPTAEERDAAVRWMDRALHEVNCDVDNNPGRVTVRRLNRTEYDNTVRDLLGVDLKLSDDFPADDVGNGFDNQGDVLTLPPLLLEKYLTAAEKIAEEAIVGDLTALLTKRKEFGRRSISTVKETFEFPQRGEYTIRIVTSADQAGSEKAKYAATLAGLPFARQTVKKDKQADVFERTVPVKAGRHTLEIKFLNDYYKPERKQDRNLWLEAIEVIGPLGTRPTDLPETHAAIVTATPEEDGGVRQAAERVFRPLVSRAYRRPATDLEVQRLAALVEAVVEDGRTYEQGVQLALQAVLCSPHFLFRIERDPTDARPGEPLGISDYELASRLSYFLWSSMPDEELLTLAAQGRLNDDETLARQVDRMLADPKATALVSGFFAQWLNLQLLDEFEPDGRRFGNLWTTATKAAMRRETELFCEEIVREDLPITTFLNADFTYVNPRLAEFYGVPWEGKTGDAMEQFYVDGL